MAGTKRSQTFDAPPTKRARAGSDRPDLQEPETAMAIRDVLRPRRLAITTLDREAAQHLAHLQAIKRATDALMHESAHTTLTRLLDGLSRLYTSTKDVNGQNSARIMAAGNGVLQQQQFYAEDQIMADGARVKAKTREQASCASALGSALLIIRARMGGSFDDLENVFFEDNGGVLSAAAYWIHLEDALMAHGEEDRL